MAAKDAFSADDTNGLNFETGVQDWNFSCGVCHVGGGQMEYDRDMNDYNPSSASSENKYYSFDRTQIVAGFMSSTNKAEIDCLMCHLNTSATGANENGTGRAWYQSMKCGQAGGIMGPMNDPTCIGTVQKDPAGGGYIMGFPAAGPFTAGTAYDPVNRNLALKTLSFNYAPSLGIGATVASWGAYIAGGVDRNYQYIATITGVPEKILAANIQGTPASQNCSACHARDDNSTGYPGMMNQVRLGYGNMVSVMPQGTAIDRDPNGTGTNQVRWIEFGCKTGMGKRGHKIGHGPNDKWGNSMFNYMFGLNMPMGTAVTSTTIPVTNPMMVQMGITSVTTKERIPDQDVHEAGGFQCATCHYAIGSSKLHGAAYAEGYIANNADGSVTIPAETNAHGLNTASGENGQFGVNYPAETIYGIDHQFAQGDNLKDTYGKNNLDSTVSCEACHIYQTHPKLARNGGTLNPPIPTHASFPAIHIDKIACATCHIPEIYITPFRLKSRDWTLGFIKRGNETNGAFKNIYDWNFDMVTFSGSPIRPLHQWATKYEKKQIYPVAPAEMPIWVSLNGGVGSALGGTNVTPGSSGSTATVDYPTIKTCNYGSRIFAQCSTNADCPGGSCQDGVTTYAAPATTKDVMAATVALEAQNTNCNATTGFVLRRACGNLNGGSPVPLFEGWPFPDGQGIDTQARIEAMKTASGGKLALLKIFHAPFDVTHGVVPKAWALGGSKQGGCVSCHSSAQPRSFDANGSDIGPNPYYSPNSVGFFEGAAHWQPQEMGTGNYDMLKNPLTMFADFDCTNIVNALCMGNPAASNSMCMGMCMGMMHNTAAACTQFCGGVAMMGNCGTGSQGGMFTDDDLFNPMTGAPSNNWVLQQCIGFMQPNFDLAMGWPNGTAAAMGMMDGVNGLQAFTLRETVTGSTYGCNPMVGSHNLAIFNMGGGTPAGIPQGTQLVAGMGDLNNCMPSSFNGTCNVTDPSTGMGTCSGGFRDGKMCLGMDLGAGANADCAGTLDAAEVPHSPFGLMLSRGEARARFKLQLQQSNQIVAPNTTFPEGVNTVWWPILTEQNPDNPAHLWAWDQAGAGPKCGAFQNEPCCTDPMTNAPTACAPGMNIRTTIHANALLGFTQSQYAALISLNSGGTFTAPTSPTAPVANFSYVVSGLTVSFDASASTKATSYEWHFGDASSFGTGTTTSHTYAADGTYLVTLTAKNDATGETNSKTTAIIPSQMSGVLALPTASFTVDNIAQYTVSITDTSSGNVNKIFVNWGDGMAGLMSAGTSTNHTYALSGTYSIILAASNYAGGTTSTHSVITLPNGTGGIDGLVTDSTGTPLQAAIVVKGPSGYGNAIYSSASGTYALGMLSAGTYTLSASRSGYVFTDQVVSVGTGTATVNFTALGAASLYNITGVLDNAPAPGGVIISCHPQGSAVVLFATYTDLYGQFAFKGLTAGTYDVVAMPWPTTGTATVTPSTVTVTITNSSQIISAGTWTYAP